MEVNTTENKTLEQDYRDLAGLLSNIVDSLPIYFFVKDTGDNFRYVYSSPLMNQLDAGVRSAGAGGGNRTGVARGQPFQGIGFLLRGGVSRGTADTDLMRI